MATTENPLTHEELINGKENNEWRDAIQEKLNSIILKSKRARANLPPGREAIR